MYRGRDLDLSKGSLDVMCLICNGLAYGAVYHLYNMTMGEGEDARFDVMSSAACSAAKDFHSAITLLA